MHRSHEFDGSWVKRYIRPASAYGRQKSVGSCDDGVRNRNTWIATRILREWRPRRGDQSSVPMKSPLPTSTPLLRKMAYAVAE